MNGLAAVMSLDSFVALLASAALKSSLVLLAALLLDLVLRRHTAALRHCVWTAAFAALLLVPFAAPLAPDWTLPLLPAQLAAGPDDGGLDAATRPSQSINRRGPPEPAATADRSGADAESASAHADAVTMPGNGAAAPGRAGALPWAALAIAAWSAGAILLLAQLGLATAGASRLCRRARPLDDPAWNALLDKVRKRVGLRVPVRLVRSDASRMPMAWGIRRHHVVLPADAEHWSNERREVVLLHELAHVRRADCLAHLLSGVAAALYWPNPLVWIARRRQLAERELACDDTVLATGACGADYAWHILEIARASGTRPGLAPAGVMMARRSQLEGRLLAALDGSRDRRHLSRVGAAAPTAVGLLMAVALAGLQPWATRAAAQPEEPAASQAPVPGSVAQEAPAQAPAAQQLTDQASASQQRTAQVPATPESAPQPAAEGRPARERVMQMFVGLLDDPDVSIRRQAVQALGQMEDPAAVAALSETMVNDENAGVRAQAAWALGMIESPDAVAALGRALTDTDANVRARVAWALGMVESADAVADLVTTLRQDAEPSVRAQAAWALGMIEDEAGLEALIDAVEEEDATVRKQALRAISMIVG